jgi:hypothetical protein
MAVKDVLRTVNCEDARPWLSTRRPGQIALTEWALVEVHLRQCPRCREEAARQEPSAGAPPFTLPRAALPSIRKTMSIARSGLTGSTALVVQGRSRLTAAAGGAVSRAIAGLMQAVSLGLGRWTGLMAQLRAAPAIALDHLVRATSRRPVGPWPPDPLPAPETRPVGLRPPPPDPPRSFARPSPRAGAAEVPAPRPAPLFAPPAGHIVGWLSVKDRTAAERELSALLGELEGTELGRVHRPRFTAIQVLVPYRRYREFTRGLTRIGFWRLEATGLSLPDEVHVTIRLSR